MDKRRKSIMVIIHEDTCKEPIEMIGKYAGICYGANTENPVLNFKRGLDCLRNNHGRTLEFPDIYLQITGHSARVIREWYTHIGGMPTRL
jgi:thymidylate synthase (FAD)